MHDDYDSPVDDLFISINKQPNKAYLFIGHMGCGKSTELTCLSRKLEKAGYKTRTPRCQTAIDLPNAAYWDFLVLAGRELIAIAKELNCDIDSELSKKVMGYWYQDVETLRETITSEGIELKVGAKISTPSLLSGLFNIFAKAVADIKNTDTQRKIIRESVEKNTSDWLGYVNYLAAKISERNGGKPPVIIFEDIDKKSPDSAGKIFSNYASLLSSMSFTTIYTFPIALTYDKQYSNLKGYFTSYSLPMIEVHDIHRNDYPDGIEAIKQIVFRRAEASLFEDGALDLLIKKTGGILRELFAAIVESSLRAQARGSQRITMANAQVALKKLKAELERLIEKKDYDFLLEIANNENTRRQIEDKDKLLEMMRALVVLEYNGEKWYDVHPLIKDFFEELGLIRQPPKTSKSRLATEAKAEFTKGK
jgi:energy-coupling factor transporter ATP-binding protein EcfA2